MKNRGIVLIIVSLILVGQVFSKHVSFHPSFRAMDLPTIESYKEVNSVALHRTLEVMNRERQSQIIEPLIEVFKQAVEDENLKVSDEAARALSLLKDPQSIEFLVQALKSEDGDARMVTAWALGEIGDKKAISPLEAVLTVETRKYVRFAVETALRKLKSKTDLN